MYDFDIAESKSALSSWNKAYERIIIGKEKDSGHSQNTHSKHSSEVLQKFEGKSRDVCIKLVYFYYFNRKTYGLDTNKELPNLLQWPN